MSSSKPEQEAAAETTKAERRQSLTKYLSKAKSVLRKDKKRLSVDAGATLSETSASKEVKPQVLSSSGFPFRNKAQQERAKALFEKYGFTLDPSELVIQPASNVERVEKPIRMRVHRQCHRCQTTFGINKVCVQCNHTRCKKCPRYPVKKSKTTATGAAKTRGVGGVMSDTDQKAASKGKNKIELTMPSKTGGQDRVRREVRQRVIRTCHKCETLFMRGEKTCGNCQHIRCSKCPRDPPKLHKYPDGYPGDVPASDDERELVPHTDRTFKKPRRVIRFYCDSCDTMFMRGSKKCAECNHDRCNQCRREPSKKVKPPPDPAVVKSVEEKLAAMNLKATSAG